jgi:Fe-S cluster assembly iron-binding protein IscA
MLTLTTGAVAVIREITHQPGLPEDTGGVRIAATATGNGSPAFKIAVASMPEPTDDVIEAEGARVFLDSEASVAFEDKSLDAEIDEDQIRFRIEDRAS